MKLVGEQYDQKLEDTDSREFTDLATKLEATVSLRPKEDDFSPSFFFFFSFSLIYIVKCELFWAEYYTPVPSFTKD